MRIIASFDKENLATRFSLYLEKEKIENTLESTYDKKQRKTIHNIWVSNEDDIVKANQFYDEFKNDPANSKFDVKYKDIPIDEKNISMHEQEEKKEKMQPRIVDPIASKMTFPYKVTYFFLIICSVLFLVDYMQSVNLSKKNNFKDFVLLTPIQKELLFDVPQDRHALDEVIIKYKLDTPEKLENPPADAQNAIDEIEKKEPSWVGFYDIILEKIHKKESKNEKKSAPLFEKIKQGEVWRLFSPTLLHGGFLHILFNMLWLWYLGKQMEPRLRFIRFSLFIIIVGIICNVAQYLMGGPYFLGFSGIITGMVGFIYIRQKVAPWEGYSVPSSVFYFIGIFIFAIFLLQCTSFIIQIFKPKLGFTSGIANTAHITGVLVGALLAKIPFFHTED